MTAKLSLLQLVQRVLSSMDSDRVDTIDETEESVQVAELARDVYYEMITDGEWPFLHSAIRVASQNNPANPTAVDLQDDVRQIMWLRYNVAQVGDEPQFRELRYEEPTEFASRRSVPGQGRLLVTIGDNLQCYVSTDTQPGYWTSFDDGTIYLDAVDQDLESTIQASKLTVYGVRIPDFLVEDDFVPDFPAHFFPLYLAELRKAAFGYFKNSQSPRDAAISISQRAQVRRLPNRTGPTREGSYFNTNYGRRR